MKISLTNSDPNHHWKSPRKVTSVDVMEERE